jgi:peptidyl-prolyl cis-trans isomerase B (cyclophilin B)
MSIRILALLALLMLPLAIMAQDNTKKSAPPTMQEAMAAQKQGRYLATITMADNKKIELVLEGAYMPYTVANFVKLAKAKFYDGLTFHRVVNEDATEDAPEFRIIQGGDPLGDGTGEPGYEINLEISPFLRHKSGAISMARTDIPDTAGSQFFITFSDAPFLDGQYAVFGWVKSGLDVVKTVKQSDIMKTVTVAPYKGTEKCPILSPGFTTGTK